MKFTEGGARFDPNSIKMDFKINNFPYSRNNTRLAMETHINSQTESIEGGQNSIQQRNVVFINHNGVFRT